MKDQMIQFISAAYSPDSKHLAIIGSSVANGKQTILIHDAETGKRVLMLHNYTSSTEWEFTESWMSQPSQEATSSLSYSPDGKQLASGSKDGIRIWQFLSKDDEKYLLKYLNIQQASLLLFMQSQLSIGQRIELSK